MKPVKGFLSEDDMFFEIAADARKHDAEMLIRAYCVTHNLDAEKLITHIEALAVTITEYLNADQATEIPQFIKRDPQDSQTREVGEHQADSEGYAEPPALFEQPIDGREPMPYVGHRSRTKGL